MTTPQDEEEGILREWAPLSKFLHKIPLRTRHGIFLESVIFTCVAADIDCIALGTSSGLIFWYNRISHDVQPLRSEKSLSPITCVASVSSVEYMVAAGDKLGIISIFRIPKDLPDWFGVPKEKQNMERYTIDEVHNAQITALTWSTNGQKLFSGDASGVVVFTEVDHRMRITRACEVVNEKFKIVQLSYCQQRQTLVVATDLRCIVCFYEKPHWRITQVGQRERHCLQELGACFLTDDNHVPLIYCCRTGLRLWKADIDGTVQHTIKFKDVVESVDKPVKLLRQLKSSRRAGTDPKEFGRLYPWRDGLLISHWQDSLIIFDPTAIKVVATIRNRDVTITAVASTQKEIFLVLGHRELVRLSYFPDAFDCSLGGVGNLASGEPVSGIPKLSLKPVEGLPIVTSPVQNSRVKLSAKTSNFEPRANEVSYGIESTILLPSIAAVSEGVPELRLDSSRQHQFSSIGQEEFDEIIFSKVEACCISAHLIPDNRPLDEIAEDFKIKEELLESTVVFPPALDDLSPASETNNTVIENFKSSNGDTCPTEESTELKLCEVNNCSPIVNNGHVLEPLNLSSNSSSSNNCTDDFETIYPRTETEKKTDGSNRMSSDEILSLNDSDVSSASVDRIVLGDEPSFTIENCNLSENLGDKPARSEENDSVASECSSKNEEPLPTFSVVYENLVDGWTKMSCPDQLSWISAYSDGVVICSPTFKVYSCESDSWIKLPYEATHLFLSPDGQMGVKLHYSSAYYSYDWRSKSNWKLLSRDVNYVYLENDKVWFVSQGELYFMMYCSELVDRISCSFKLSKIFGDSETLFAITDEHRLVMRRGEDWLPVWSFPGKIKHFCCGPNKLYWASDYNDRLFVIDDVRRSWWQHIKAPCKIVCFASRPQALWLLSEDGEIFSKQGISHDNPIGSDWKKMDSEQLREKQMQIIHLSCGFDVVWACDIRGNVLMLVGSPHAISNCSFTPAWVLVDGSALQNHTFTKVYVGPRCHMVWALDDAGNVYVREAIFPELPVGTSWVHVPGLKASHLSISTETVWALGHGGIYRRAGITESNFIGDLWTCVDVAPDNLSVTVDEKLLSVDDGRLRTFDEMVFPFSDEVVVEKDWTLL
ncbi:Hypothetical protein NTJ_01507 [Nesidiocoris tenuis]|uniref:Tectonin beta-propeller repeat-containing protein n=1 Tax=Nesidiocoris tenuis TaxID=355587 RepID=A0ABN7A918_9HEMI|nr:Hypothetical protein NTJ_01507 [Nesidiocoris tenuis]